jgi:hypothetical protein
LNLPCLISFPIELVGARHGRAPKQAAEKVPRAVILSEAKDLHLLLSKEILRMLRAVYPERGKLQTLRFAQGDSEGLSMTDPLFPQPTKADCR